MIKLFIRMAMPQTTKRKASSRIAPDAKANRDPRHLRMLDVLGQFRVVIKSMRQHYQMVERRTGVNGAQLWALAHVAGHGGTRVGELARALAIHASTASNLVGQLESRRLVTRRRFRTDRRTVQLYATLKGENALKDAPRPLIGVLQQALRSFPPPASTRCIGAWVSCWAK